MNRDLSLRTWRQSKGITLAAIAESTKISVTQLQAIEAGEFRKLPGGIYNTNYIRQYARAIQFDEQELLEYYRSSCEAPAVESPRSRFGGPLLQHQ